MIGKPGSPVDRGDVDDGAASGVFQCGKGGASAEKKALHVQVEHLVINGFGRLLDRASAGHARVVDQNVQATECVSRLGDDAFAVVDEPEIALECDRLAAG